MRDLLSPDNLTGPPGRLERLADAALYLAKRQGRDRAELAEPATGEVPAPSANGLAPVPAS